jgi:hypothetical protein
MAHAVKSVDSRSALVCDSSIQCLTSGWVGVWLAQVDSGLITVRAKVAV